MSARRVVSVGTAAGLTLLACPPLAAAAAAAGHKPSTHDAAQAGRWALAIALAFLVFGIPLMAYALRGAWRIARGRGKGQQPGLWWGRSLVVGEDNRVSTSKTTALVWTYTLAGALLSFLIARWLGHPDGFSALTSQGLNAQYAVLIGGPLGAAILAKGIVSSQVASGSAAKPKAPAPTLAQLVQNDAGEADLGDVQYLLFNVVALFFFYGEFFRAPQLGIPTIPDVLVGLTSVSAVGFVGKKVLSGPGGISAVQPSEAGVGDPVTITTAGIIQAADDLPGITVSFGKAPVSPGALTATTTTSLGVLIGATVPADAAGQVDVTVFAPNAKPASWSGFKVTPRISRGQNLVGRRGETIVVQATGVAGLGPQLRTSVGGQPAETTLNDTRDLHVTIPETAPTGETTLELASPGGPANATITVIDQQAPTALASATDGAVPATTPAVMP